MPITITEIDDLAPLDAFVDATRIHAFPAAEAAPDRATALQLAEYLLTKMNPLNPMAHGAAGDGEINDAAALNALQPAIVADFDSTSGTYRAIVDLGNRRYRSDSSINWTDLNDGPAPVLKSGTILSHATGKAALDATNSRENVFSDLAIVGDSTDIPNYGIQFARPVGGTVAEGHMLRNVYLEGTFDRACIINYASEVSNWESVFAQNDKLSASAYCIVWQGTEVLPLTSDYSTIADTESYSNIIHRARHLDARRVANTAVGTVTSITKANPAVVTVTGTIPANGSEITIHGAGGMTEVNYLTFTVANGNAGAKTFELAGVNSTGYGTYTSGAVIRYKTGPVLLINDISALHLDEAYLVTYGSHCIEMRCTPNALIGQGFDFKDVRLNIHIEGVVDAMVKFTNVGSGSEGNRVCNGFRLYEHNSQAKYILGQDATGTGVMEIRDADIDIQNYGRTPTSFFDDASKFKFVRARIVTPEVAVFPAIYSLKDFSGEVVAKDATYPHRLYPDIKAHQEVEEDFDGVALNTFRWSTFAGSTPGTVTLLSANATGSTLARFTNGASGSTHAVNGVGIYGGLHWIPGRGDLRLDMVFYPRAIASVAYYIGFTDESKLEMPFELAAADALTSNATSGAGVLFDTAADTDNWWGVGVRNDTDATPQNFAVAPVVDAKEIWSLRYGSTGNMKFYRNGAQIGSEMTLASLSTTPLCPCIVAFRRASSAASLIDVDYIRVRQLRM